MLVTKLITLQIKERTEKEWNGNKNKIQQIDIVNIGLHFFLKNVRPYAASCSEA